MTEKLQAGVPTIFDRFDQGAEARLALIDAYKQAEASRRMVDAFSADTDNVINLPKNRIRLSGPVALGAVAITTLLAAACGGGSETKANSQPTISPPTRTAEVPPTVVPTETKATPVPVTREVANETLTRIDKFYQERGKEVESKLVTINGTKGFKTKEGNIRFNEPAVLRRDIERLITLAPGSTDPDTFAGINAQRINAGNFAISYLVDAYRTTGIQDFADFAEIYLGYMRNPRAIGIGSLPPVLEQDLKSLETDLHALEAQSKGK